jgi:hypothetical protein
MENIKQVRAFQTSDDRLFYHERDAVNHEKFLGLNHELRDLLEKNELFDDGVFVQSIIIDNKEKLKEILSKWV